MRQRIRKYWESLQACRNANPHWLHKSHNAAHLAYFCAVFAQGSGVYSYIAGGLFGIGLLALFFKNGESL